MIRKNWLGQRTRAVSVAVVFLFSSALLAVELRAQTAQSTNAGSAIKPTAPPAFVVAPSVSLGYSPTSVATGQLTPSGKLDLVTADYQSGSITVFTALGKGSFAPGVKYASGAQPASVTIADIDGNGKADVILANESEGVISVFAGNGDGTLGPRKTYVVGFAPSFVAVGDFTGSGKLDVAVAGASGKTLAILQNDGTGNLKRPVNYALSDTPTALVAEDFNHDGHLDLAVATANGTVSVLLGKGNGQFSSLPDISIATGALSSIAVGDFNRDGNDDLAVTSATQNQVAVLLGQGDGKFGPAISFAVGNSPISTQVADVDGDGIPDLIVVNKSNNTFSVLSGVGNGSFKSALHFVVGNTPLGAVAGDYYGNGHIDVATIDQLSQTMSMPVAVGDGTFQAGRAYVAGVQPIAVASGDLTGGGKSDLVVANYCAADANCGGSGSAAVLLAGAGGAYQLSSTYAMGAGSVSIALLDLNGDKKLDLIALNRVDKTLSVRLGAGDGTFGRLITIPLSQAPIALAASDFNKDGSVDLAVLGDCGSVKCSQPGEVEVLLGSGDGNFHSASTFTVGYSPVALAVGATFVGGSPDILVANRCGQDASCQSGGTASVLFGNGAGAFKAGADVALGNSPSSIALANLRGTGVLDLVVSRSTDNAVAILPGTGSGSFKAAVPYVVGNSPGALAIADFNGDGKPDVAVANTGDSTVSVLFGRSDGTLQPAFSLPVGGAPAGLAPIGTAASGPSSLATANGAAGSLAAGANVTVLSNLKARPQAVGTTASTVTLSATPATLNVNSSVTLSVIVAGGSGTPTGTVDITGNGTPATVCSGLTLDGTGAASCSSSALDVNTTTLTATYNGDTTYAAQTGTASVTVHALTPTISFTPAASPASPSALNTAVTFTAALTGVTLTPVLPSGSMTFLLNGSAATCVGAGSNTIVVTSTGAASCQIQNMHVATNNVVSASYAGDANYTVASAASAPAYTITKPTPTISLTPAPSPASPSALNTSVTFKATLAGVSFTPVAPGGTVAFFVGSTPISGCATAALVSQVATCVTSSLPTGVDSITATYAGDPNFNGATSPPLSYTITALHPTISFTPAPSPASPSALNTAVTFTAALSGATLTPVLPSGTMTFLLNGAAATCVGGGSNAITVNSSGAAVCQIQNMPAGSNNVTATYSGDTNYTVASAGAAPAYTITALPATLSISALPGSSVPAGTSVTFTTTVSAATIAPVAPSGTVTWLINGISSADCPAVKVNASQKATCTTQALLVPADTISASYSGDTNFTVASPATFTETVGKTGPTVTLSSSLNTAAVNQSVTFTATVPAPAGQTTGPFPTGSVTFMQGGTVLCSAPQVLSTPTLPLSLANQPKATCTTSFATAGTYPVVANYSGDSNFTAGTPGNTSEIVDAATTAIKLNSATDPSSVNQAVDFTAVITPAFTGTAIPQGTVAFTNTTAPTSTLCTVTVAANGTVPACAHTFAAAGTFNITAAFTPSDTNFVASTSSAVSQVVGAGTTGISLTSTPNPSTVNQSVTFSSTFSPAITGATKPQGTVAYSDTIEGALCSGTVTAGVITDCTYVFKKAGAHSVTVAFTSSDSNFTSVNSGVVTQTVNQAGTTTTEISSQNPSSVNQSVTFTATVAATPTGAAVPTGTVTFNASVNSQTSVLCATAQAVSTTGGVTTASCTAPLPTAGAYTITAVYSGDSNFVTSKSAGLAQTVGTPSTTVTFGTPLPSPPVNQAVTFSVTVKPSFTGSTSPTGTVTFTDTDTKTSVCAPATLAAAAGGTATASCQVTFVNAGSHTITASYAGDGNFAAGTNSAAITVAQSATTLAITPTANPSVATTPVTFVAVVSPATSGVAVPSGTVTFMSTDLTLTNQASCKNVPLTNSGGSFAASCTVIFPHTTNFTTGQIGVTASYSGDSNFKTNSNNPTITQVVQDFTLGLTVTTTGTNSSNLSGSGGIYVSQGDSNTNDQFNPATITIAVKSSGGYVDALSATCAVVSDAATVSVPPTCSLSTATPSGATATSFTLTISAPATADVGSYTVKVTGIDQAVPSLSQSTAALKFSVIGVSGTLTLAQTGSGSATAVFNTPAGATGTLTVSGCTTILPALTGGSIACSGPQGGVAIGTGSSNNNSTSVSVTLTLSATTAQLRRSSDVFEAAFLGIPVLALVGWIGSRKSRRKNFLRFIGLILLAIGMTYLSACGGSFKRPPPPTPTGITPGSYLLQVKASDGTNNYYAVIPLVVNAN